MPAVLPQKSMFSTIFWSLKAFLMSQVELVTRMRGLPQLLGLGFSSMSEGTLDQGQLQMLMASSVHSVASAACQYVDAHTFMDSTK
jgi:hypothetical protein